MLLGLTYQLIRFIADLVLVRTPRIEAGITNPRLEIEQALSDTRTELDDLLESVAP